MIAIPPWLAVKLDELLPTHNGAERDAFARAIFSAIPLGALGAACARGAAEVLAEHGVKDVAHDISYEIGAAAAQHIAQVLRRMP